MEARTLKGFRDYLPDVEAPRQAMIRRIEDVFERHGFLPTRCWENTATRATSSCIASQIRACATWPCATT
jgi:hypothetical protein